MRHLQKKNLKESLVIVCEGTDTEYQYFEEIADAVMSAQPGRYSRIKIVPTPEEKAKSDSRRKAYKRRIRQESNPLMLYYVKEDTSLKEYKENRTQPNRYIREAQLFLLEDGFSEAWAVFDKDVHPGHERAWELADRIPKVRIAFSSYSFEEWILCHFERNSHAYHHSLCKRKDCGINNPGCQGRRCLIGRIRQKQYIPNFTKSTPNLYKIILSPHLTEACINAAWLGHIEPGIPPYKRNPYTDIDEFVLYLLDKQERYEWKIWGSQIMIDGLHFKLYLENNELIIKYDSAKSVIVRPSQLNYCNAKGTTFGPVLSNNLLFSPERNEHRIPINKKFHYLRFEESTGNFHRMVYLFELPFFCR